MLGIHEGCETSSVLRLGNNVEAQGRLSRRLRAEDLNYASLWDAAYTDGYIKTQRSCRDGFHVRDDAGAPQFHDRALAELSFNLAHCHIHGP